MKLNVAMKSIEPCRQCHAKKGAKTTYGLESYKTIGSISSANAEFRFRFFVSC